ncbi:hypothetical protein [Phytoactinopolyspora limicola]|uniref:hypothetical protein n=1 Tax=Phytoactinopolyspora limicola TaxID=2715536 RepID=UPI001407523F|nr:hypothetical protein [Phytoactinopolyspora limicola]
MYQSRRRIGWLAVVPLTLVIGACGSDDDASRAADPESAATTENHPEPDGDSDERGSPGDASPTDGHTDGGPPDGDQDGDDQGGDGQDGDDQGGDDGDDVGGRNGADDETVPGENEAPPPRVPETCPDEVVAAGGDIAGGFEHVEVGPVEGLDVLTCEWRASNNSIATIEVSFSGELFGTDLGELDDAREVTVAGVDGYVMHFDEGTVNMFQFHAENLYVTGGSIEVEGIDADDVLELAEAAIEALES